MIVCSICSGRHSTTACATAARYVDECLSGTPDEYRRPLTDVADLLDLDAARRRRREREQRDTGGMAERSRRRAAQMAAYDARRTTPHRSRA